LLRSHIAQVQEHPPGEEDYRFYRCPDIDTAGTQVISHAGTALLTESIAQVRLDHALSQALEKWSGFASLELSICWSARFALLNSDENRQRRRLLPGMHDEPSGTGGT
jgi:DNA-binding transcriptional LysR family regulator